MSDAASAPTITSTGIHAMRMRSLREVAEEGIRVERDDGEGGGGAIGAKNRILGGELVADGAVVQRRLSARRCARGCPAARRGGVHSRLYCGCPAFHEECAR